MNTLRKRFPPRRDIGLVFAAVAFPIHAWAIWRVLRAVPAWVLQLTLWDLLGAVAYILVFALFESLVLLSLLIFVSVLLPARALKDRFVAQSTMAVFLTSIWAVAAHYEWIRVWGSEKEFLAWAVLYLASLAIVALLVHRVDKLSQAIHTVVEWLAPLSYLYGFMGVLSLLIVITRNIVGGPS